MKQRKLGWISNQNINLKSMICTLGKLQYQIPREKFKPEPVFETRTFRSLS